MGVFGELDKLISEIKEHWSEKSHDFLENSVSSWEFPGMSVARTLLPLQGAWVQSLFGELRSHMPHDMAKKIKN